MAGLSRDEVLADVEGMRWGEFKPRLADALVAHLQPIQRRYKEVMQDEGALDAILAQVGAEDG
jgi:tryptophanyl-tRNA synthetase